jgi:D-amino-acid dehydrogenase
MPLISFREGPRSRFGYYENGKRRRPRAGEDLHAAKCRVSTKRTFVGMQSDRPEVLIIGGGLVGAASAWQLSARGAKVTVLDRGEIGHGCSYGNAGWVTPCFAMPLPMPGMLIKCVKWMLNSRSPLYIQPRASRSLVSWLWKFLNAMNRDQMLASVDALVGLSKLSLELYRKLDEQTPGAFGFKQTGLLMLAQDDTNMAAALEEMELVSARGVRGRRLNASEARELEPSVQQDSVVGGVFFADEAHVEPLATVRHLIDLASKAGAAIQPKTEVLEFVRRNGSIESVVTTRGEIKADKILLAAGAWSGRLAAKLNLPIPILSGKGYSVILPPLKVSPKIPIYILDRKIAITPRSASLRIAGTFELVDLNESVTMSRVQTMLDGAGTILDIPRQVSISEIWRGLRPCTPDGVPIMDWAPHCSNLFIAAGHQMLGLQTATGTGTLVADLLSGATPCVNPEPFRISRFC